MNLAHRIDLMVRLGEYMSGKEPGWAEARTRASVENGWFTPEFIDKAVQSIVDGYLQRESLEALTSEYPYLRNDHPARKVGIVMAGNIPLVGFHDLLCVFLSGHIALIKPSSRDKVLVEHLVETLVSWVPEMADRIQFQEMLKHCDAYIATGSNNSSRYFAYYFGKYPNIIRKNRTSVALLDGSETREELDALADDVHLYFGLGCRNITKILVPEGYDFIPLLDAFKKYGYQGEHHKYKNNYDYNLALHILNGNKYMSSGSLLLAENPSLFSPISQLNYEYYANKEKMTARILANPDLQCLVGHGFTPFGQAQCPGVRDFADGVDTMAFLGGI